MSKLIFLTLALVLIVVLAKDEKKPVQAAQEIKKDQFLMNIWRDKRTCDGVPSLPLSLLNDNSKCQVILKVLSSLTLNCEC
jgi:hypothetical protein